MNGPSPRVRGKRVWPRWWWGWSTGHPRACGENEIAPPGCEIVSRAIPARAGKTPLDGINVLLAVGPSPRVRGKHKLGHPPTGRRTGPSPRVRGKRCGLSM